LAEHWGLRPLPEDDRVPPLFAGGLRKIPMSSVVPQPCRTCLKRLRPRCPGTCRGGKELGQQIAA
jgi:hypothetical protein